MNMQALKILVVGMGVLIVAGVMVLVTMIYVKLTNPTNSETARAELTLPTGARITGMGGSGDRVILYLTLPDGSEKLLNVDAARGRIASDLTILRK